MLEHTRQPQPTPIGNFRREEHTYKHNGSCDFLVPFCPQAGSSQVKVTAQRKGIDYAECLCDLVEIHWPKTEKIRIIQDNLNTHQGASWYKDFAAPKAGGIFRKLEFRDRLKHANWLNIAEIEIDVLDRQYTVLTSRSLRETQT